VARGAVNRRSRLEEVRLGRASSPGGFGPGAPWAQPFDDDGRLLSNFHVSSPPQQVMVKDSLGSSVTMPVVIVRPYG